jgi:hypothetical protein
MFMKTKIIAPCLLGLILVSRFGFSQETGSIYASDPSQQLGTRSTGRAHSTVASDLDHDSLFQNPASSVFKNQYAVSFEYGVVGNGLSASVVDTQSGPVGGGIFYSRKDFQGVDLSSLDSIYGNLERIEEQAGFALMGKLSDQIGLGANVKWSYLKSFDSRVGNGRAWTFDVGAKFKPTPTLAFGLLGQNLLKDDRGVIPRKFSAGLEYTAVLGLDLTGEIHNIDSRSLIGAVTLPNSESTFGWALGAQYRFASGPVLRSGFQRAGAWDRNAFSLGAGYQNKSFSIDYAFMKATSVGSSFAHQVGFTGYF